MRSKQKNELFVLHHNGQMLVTSDYLSTKVRVFRSVYMARGAIKNMRTLSDKVKRELTIVRYTPKEVVEDA